MMKKEDLKEKVIMNFSGIYKDQQFWQQNSMAWVEVQELTGCNCYCDEEAQSKIREKLQMYTGSGIHYIDSGNYHYVSRLWIEKIKEQFCLIVFDNHTDMQQPAFGGLLSCGGWVSASLEEIPQLQKIVLIGPDEEAYSQTEPELREKVVFLSRERLKEMSLEEKRYFFEQIQTELPVYISVDKDVLCMEDASTTWSQGDMRLEELNSFLEIILRRCEVIGIDICGECDPDEGGLDTRNDKANAEILKLLEECMNEE